MKAERSAAEWPTGGVELIVDFSCQKTDNVEILRIAPLPFVPAAVLQAPRLTTENLARLRPGMQEFVVDAVGDGRRLQSFAFERAARRYFDLYDAGGRLAGAPGEVRPPERDIRFLRIPWSGEVRTLSLRRTEVRQKPIAGGEPELELVAHGAIDASAEQLPWETRWQPGKPRPLPGMDASLRFTEDGHFDRVVSLEGNGSPGTRFDIVITGDGFQERELDRFGSLARELRRGFEEMEPFRSHKDHINWHLAYVVSKDSGIENCPDRGAKRTFLGVKGCWNGSDQPGYLGTTQPGRVHAVAEHAAPIVDLIIVIANCQVYGGHAWPRAKIAIVPAHPDWFARLAAHECAHTMAWLAEEYISSVAADPAYMDPNLAELIEVGPSVQSHVDKKAGQPASGVDTVWWKDLAAIPGEREGPGRPFKFVHVIGDGRDGTDPYSPAVGGATGNEIGAFWGCQDVTDGHAFEDLLEAANLSAAARAKLKRAVSRAIEKPMSNADRYYWNPLGAPYFRPSARCRMRHLKDDFCRVCQHVIANRILEACGLPLVEPRK